MRVSKEEHYAIQRFHNARPRTLKCTAKEFGRSIGTIRKVLSRPWKFATRAPSEKVVKRRARVARMALEVEITPLGHHRPRFPNSRSIGNVLNTPARTIRRDLQACKLKSYVRPKVSTLQEKHLKERLEFCRKELQRSERTLKKTAFSDESLLTCSQMYDDRSQYAACRENVLARESPNPFNTGGRVLVWATVGVNYKSDLVVIKQPKNDEDGSVRRLTADRYVRLCLSKVADDMVRRRHRFMQDSARCHTAKSTIAYLKRKGITLVDKWPAGTPQLNRIEGLWSVLKARIAKRYPTSSDELARVAKEEWAKIPQKQVNKAVEAYVGALKRCRLRRGRVA